MPEPNYCDVCGFRLSGRTKCYPCGGHVCMDCSRIVKYGKKRVRACRNCIEQRSDLEAERKSEEEG